jgi:hypothetical protein
LTCCENDIELHITNSSANQKTFLRDDVNGFQFASNRNEKLAISSNEEMSNNFDIPWLKVLEELIKKDKNLSTTTRTTTPATQIEDQMSQLRSSANIEATLMENRQKMLKKEIY